MGILFTPRLSWTLAKTKLAAQAQKAIMQIQSYQRQHGYLLQNELFKLFDSLVKPILCYAVEIWGYEHSDIIDSVQIVFCKRFLGVNNSTNNCMALGECGRLPLSVTYQTKCIKYWCKLIHMQETRYPKNCYQMLKSLDDLGRITWATKVKNLLFQHGYGIVWISQDVGDIAIFISQFKQRLIDCATQTWNSNINSSSRCDFYKQFKTLLTPETYLNTDIKYPLRKALAKFRCSSHTFRIETGRHQNLARSDRICLHCQETQNYSTVEDKYHVFFTCSKYAEIRAQYLSSWYDKSDSTFELYNLLKVTDFRRIKLLSTYIYQLLLKYNQT